MKRGLISTPPSDMLPTAEGGKVNAWLRQKNTGIYVRPRLFSPYVEEAKVGLFSNLTCLTRFAQYQNHDYKLLNSTIKFIVL